MLLHSFTLSDSTSVLIQVSIDLNTFLSFFNATHWCCWWYFLQIHSLCRTFHFWSRSSGLNHGFLCLMVIFLSISGACISSTLLSSLEYLSTRMLRSSSDSRPVRSKSETKISGIPMNRVSTMKLQLSLLYRNSDPTLHYIYTVYHFFYSKSMEGIIVLTLKKITPLLVLYLGHFFYLLNVATISGYIYTGVHLYSVIICRDGKIMKMYPCLLLLFVWYVIGQVNYS